jgi:hypothetical protein
MVPFSEWKKKLLHFLLDEQVVNTKLSYTPTVFWICGRGRRRAQPENGARDVMIRHTCLFSGVHHCEEGPGTAGFHLDSHDVHMWQW